jgi:hypothetical protein
MATFAFDNELILTGPFRAPRQMLGDQEYDGHTSVHDDATADKLGLPGAPMVRTRLHQFTFREHGD